MAIARVQTGDSNINQLQQNIAQALRPLFQNPVTQGTLLTSVSLATGTNTIAHKLNRKLQGWLIVRLRASATVYDLQDANKTPESTLVLNASAAVVVDLYVF